MSTLQKLIYRILTESMVDASLDFLKGMVCANDALIDILPHIDLDLYINKANQGFTPLLQKGSTCYANASAVVIHLATKRIFEREGGYPDFLDIRQTLIEKHGADGAATEAVLKEECPKHRLHCKAVETEGALKAITAKRPVIARFRLTDDEWKKFSMFYKNQPTGTLSKEDLDITKRPAGSRTGGHAVVLTSFNSEGLVLMNSWGTGWGNSGFFSVKNADVLDLKFVDVYWTLNDLRPSEIKAYESEGPNKIDEMVASLKRLPDATYRCPLCSWIAYVKEFTGQLDRATCPGCRGSFNTNREDAHDLKLSIYLIDKCRFVEEIIFKMMDFSFINVLENM